MERKEIRLNSQTSKSNVNVDEYMKIGIMSDTKILPPDALDRIVNAREVFNNERQASPYYRILGTLNPLISNPLFNLADSAYQDAYTWKDFNYSDSNGIFKFDTPVYPVNVNNNLKEKDGWFGYFDPNIEASGLCNFFDMEPKRQRMSFVPDNTPYHSNFGNLTYNWELTITYPASVDSGHTMVNGGLSIVDVQEATVATRQMTSFGVPCMHNLSIGDTVLITGTTGYDGQYLVQRVGLDNGDYQDSYFVIDVPFIPNTINGTSRMIKYINDVPCSYYFRKFRRINVNGNRVISSGDSETYKLAFSENIYVDSLVQFAFNEDINVSGLTDNLGRPLSELYLTIIKTDSNGLFTNVSSGIETPFIPALNTSINPTYSYLQNIPVINKIHNGGTGSTASPFPSHFALENDVMSVYNYNNDFYGDLVEYNTVQLNETILADIYHRFNTYNRQSSPNLTYIVVSANTNPNNLVPAVSATISLGPRQEGYYYKAHNLIKIRNFSNFFDTGDANTVDIPSYAFQSPDGTYLWRTLLDIGFNETNVAPLDYPFLNGCHYMYDNYCFLLKRQDPFDLWNLYYSTYPADPIGESITSQFNTFTPPNVC